MSKTRKVLGGAVVLIIALGFASAASALPPSCFTSCTCFSSCGQLCSVGSWISTCGEEYLCRDFCFRSAAPESAPVTPVAAAEECPVEAPEAVTSAAPLPEPVPVALVE